MSMHDDNLCELREVYALGGLTPDEQKLYEQHLTQCTECQMEVARLKRDTEALLLDFDLVEPPQGMRQRVLGAIFAEEPGETASQDAVPEASGEPTQASFREIGDEQTADRKFRRPARVWLPWASAAAAFVVVSAGTIWWANNQLQPAAPSPFGTVSQTISLQPKAGSGSAKMWVTATTSQSQMLIHFTNLTPTSGTQVYQVWLLPQNGNPVSAGVFRPDAGGKAVFASLMPKGKYDAVAVTLEPKAIDAKPLGTMMFQAKL